MPFITHSGSKQFIVSPGQRFVVDILKDVNENDIIEMPLLLSFGAEKSLTKLEVKVIGHAKGPKIRVVKFKSKSNYHRQYGFRPHQTVLEVVGGEVIKVVKEDQVETTKEVKTVKKATTTKVKETKVK